MLILRESTNYVELHYFELRFIKLHCIEFNYIVLNCATFNPINSIILIQAAAKEQWSKEDDYF